MKKSALLISLMVIGFINYVFSQFKSENDLIGTWISEDLKKGNKWVFMEHHLLLRVDSAGKELMCAYHLDTLKKDLWVITQLPGNPDRSIFYFKITKEGRNSLDMYLYKGRVIHADKSIVNDDMDLTDKNIIASLHRIKSPNITSRDFYGSWNMTYNKKFIGKFTFSKDSLMIKTPDGKFYFGNYGVDIDHNIQYIYFSWLGNSDSVQVAYDLIKDNAQEFKLKGRAPVQYSEKEHKWEVLERQKEETITLVKDHSSDRR